MHIYTQIGVDWRMFMAPIYKLWASLKNDRRIQEPNATLIKIINVLRH